MLTPIVPDVLKAKVSVFVDLFQKAERIREQSDNLRKMEAAHHERTLSETVDRLEMETRRNRFFSLAVDMLAIAGFDGYFKQINPSWQKVLGLAEEQLKQKPIIDFVHPDDAAATVKQFSRLSLGSTTEYFENRCRCSDDRFRWIGWTAAAFPSEQLIYVFARDITSKNRPRPKSKS